MGRGLREKGTGNHESDPKDAVVSGQHLGLWTPDVALCPCGRGGIFLSAALAQKALPECNIVFIEGDEMKEKLSGYLSVLFEQNPQSVGGALPDDAFYFSR